MNQDSISPHDISLSRVTEFFLEELRRGNAPSVDVFANAFPHLSDEIRAELPIIAMLEQSFATEKRPSKSKVPLKWQLGGCLIEEEIGRGAMGIVYRAHQMSTDRKVAVKVLTLQGAHSVSNAKRFELERCATARLEHPNIVPVHSYGYIDCVAYLVMKYIEGHSLLDLQEGMGDSWFKAKFTQIRTDWRSLAQLGADVASGLHHSHEQGLVHRDIKPANLMIDRQGKVWITDYGLAKIHDYARSLSGTGDAIGTPRYMAPEQIRGICDSRSDIYSLGITMYELATGEKPWCDKAVTSLIVQRASLDLVDVRIKNPDVPEALAKIIMKACAFSPEDRYQSSKELCFVLNRFNNGMLPSDRRSRRRETDEIYERKTQRIRVCATAAAIVAVFAVSNLSNYMNSNSHAAFARIATKTRFASTRFQDPSVYEERNASGLDNREFYRQSEFAPADGDVASKEKPVGTKIVSLSRLIERSTLGTKEKQRAFQIIQAFANAAFQQRLSESEASVILSRLNGYNFDMSTELDESQPEDEQLREWLIMVNASLKAESNVANVTGPPKSTSAAQNR